MGLLLLLYMYHCDCVGREQVSPQVTSLCKQLKQESLTRLGQVKSRSLPDDPIHQELARPSKMPRLTSKQGSVKQESSLFKLTCETRLQAR